MSSVVQDAMLLVQNVPKALKDCGINSPKRAAELGMEHIKSVHGAECTKDIETLLVDVMDVAQMVQSGNVEMSKIVKDLQSIMKTVTSALSDCKMFKRKAKMFMGTC
jgi:hypothetical protein